MKKTNLERALEIIKKFHNLEPIGHATVENFIEEMDRNMKKVSKTKKR